jgi:predicted ATP-binding protein involved in virulence
MMVALIADLAIRTVTLNAQFLPAETLGPEDEPLPRVLRETPGVVLIDELDVHLHPKWQRRVASDLKRTFPNVQFVCTSHSPQVIGEVRPEEIRILPGDEGETETEQPVQSKGMDSNWILETVQGADERDPDVKRRIKAVFEHLARKELATAELEILKLRTEFGNSGDVQRAMSQLERLRLLGA